MNELGQTLGTGLQGGLLVVVALGIILLLRTSIRAVKEYDRLVIFFIGRFRTVRGPGLTFVVPFVESVIRVDMRETIIDIPSQTAITKDNASIGIDFLVYYRITDPELSVTKVEDVVEATGKIATTTLRAVIGDIVLDDVLSRRDQINDVLRVKLDETTERWGMKITTVEIREIEPPRAILEAMNRQMSAERDRRAEVTLAEGEREAAIARAEGSKQSAILEAEGQKQAQILRAEAEREAQELRAHGYANALKAIYKGARGIDNNTMALQYMDMLQKVGSSPSTKFVLPMELTGIAQNIASAVQGNGASQPTSSNGKRQEQPMPLGEVAIE
ncbi:MAG: SPFH domain-containing protein [Chloroflexi bacterium]|nr:SPFH domain-containing protein [Chloroflexota bacterium]MCY3580968.1 SPFH domain-containing protein [Chloroflexota bacterium]MCY3717644.1 SPFH domain-containing protein [Chloroflexota bacterium]MDE2650515.1 SPFH domain-containing protein [Chloroflexota bacterium]MXV91976.1 SPFH/Band 7/PHB domain protein [Chloroflexota bacterium]